MVGVGDVEFGGDFHCGVGIGPDRDDADFPEDGLFDMVERSFRFLSVHFALALDEFALLHIGSDGELPVRTGLALCDNVLRVVILRDDFAGDLQRVVLHAGGDHADPRIRLVLVICQKRHGVGNLHPGEIDDHRMLPARQIHFPAAVGNSGDFGLPARRFNEGEFTQCSLLLGF